MEKDIDRVLLSEEQLKKRVAELGARMLAVAHDDKLLASLAGNVAKMALRNADERIVDCVMRIIEEK